MRLWWSDALCVDADRVVQPLLLSRRGVSPRVVRQTIFQPAVRQPAVRQRIVQLVLRVAFLAGFLVAYPVAFLATYRVAYRVAFRTERRCWPQGGRADDGQRSADHRRTHHRPEALPYCELRR